MRKTTIEKRKICLKCKNQGKKIKIGYNRSGHNALDVKECGTRYTLMNES